uniref:Uncharacterized protein n=1 Tax=Romanomermis culicivorax TaxID=13658 RepID=A0A915KCI5_ROMCU
MTSSENDAYDTVEEMTTPEISTTQKSKNETSKSQTKMETSKSQMKLDNSATSVASYTQMQRVSKTGGERRQKGICMQLDCQPTACVNMQTLQLNPKSTGFGADGNVILLRTGGLPTKPRSDQLFGAKGQRPRHLLADCKLRKTNQGILQASSAPKT